MALLYITKTIEEISKESIMETLLQQLQESLLNHARPVQVAFHLYEILSEAGFDDDLITEVSEALTDIVA